ncbi:hypothetical protein E2C01_086690 [Portunus trituberculatus]|nr:hypothetical protein [Portunus trituberculatus]
MQHPSEP